jgi:deazaflavin-dependent oxidoreductase (nitroreductase family)
MPLSGDYEPSPATWVRDQVETYEASAGREANTLRDTGLPVVIVTMRGKKSGKLRKVALMRVEHDGDYALVGSKGGAEDDPTWVANLVADPNITIQDGPAPVDMTVHIARGEERVTWWDRGVEAFPNYAEYQKKTDREIPVFVASPTTVTE